MASDHMILRFPVSSAPASRPLAALGLVSRRSPNCIERSSAAKLRRRIADVPARRLGQLLLAGVLLVVVGAVLTAGLTATGTAAGVGPANAALADNGSGTGGPNDHEHPDNPRPPDEIDGRIEVQDPSAMPYAAIGHVMVEPDTGLHADGEGASGVLVSQYHVLTAAHVVEDDDDGSIHDSFSFTPGYSNLPGNDVDAPYGRAYVTSVDDVRVHSGWDGQYADGDLALLTLDRPVGQVAGYMDLGGWSGDPATYDIQHAGYLDNVSGTRQLTSDPQLLEVGGTGQDTRFRTCTATGEGDSGSPVWRTIDGDATILGIHSWGYDDHSACAIHGAGHAKLTDANVNLIQSWMSADAELDAKAQLVVGHDVDWAPGDGPTARTVSHDDTVELSAPIYNNGPLAIGAPTTVQFSVQRTDNVRTPLCTDEVTVGAYDSTTASCTVDDLPDIDVYGLPAVYATVDPDEQIPEYSTAAFDPAEPQTVEHLTVDSANVVTDLEADPGVTTGGSFEVTATIDNAGTDNQHYTPTVTIDATQADCTPSSQTVSIVNAFEDSADTATFTCVDQGSTVGDDYDVTVSTPDDSRSTEVEVTSVDYTADADFTTVDVDVSGLPLGVEQPAIEEGDEFTVSGEIENQGSEAATRIVHFGALFECANSPDPMPGPYQQQETVHLNSGESTTVSFHCDIPDDVPELDGQSELVVTPSIGAQDHPDNFSIPHALQFVDEWTVDDTMVLVPQSGSREFLIDQVSGTDAATVGEDAGFLVVVDNQGPPSEGDVWLEVDGEPVDEQNLSINRYSTGLAGLSYELQPEDVGQLDLTVQTGEDSQTVTVDVAPGPTGVEIADGRNAVTHAAQVYEVDANVTDRGAATDETVQLVVDGEVVDTATASPAAGGTETVTLQGNVSVTAGQDMTVEVVGSNETATASVPVKPPIELSIDDLDVGPGGEDGLYRDMNGDGSVSQDDVVLFFENQHKAEVQQYPTYFDYTGNGNVGHDDVNKLFEYVVTN